MGSTFDAYSFYLIVWPIYIPFFPHYASNRIGFLVLCCESIKKSLQAKPPVGFYLALWHHRWFPIRTILCLSMLMLYPLIYFDINFHSNHLW